jgi:hypothetical protein
MSKINTITVRASTGNREHAGTDGRVYLGIGGREFRLATTSNEFRTNSTDTFILGDAYNVENPGRNDPREPEIMTEDLNKFPVYIRFEPCGDHPDWNIEELTVTVEPGSIRYRALEGSGQNLWLGERYGKFCYLKRA